MDTGRFGRTVARIDSDDRFLKPMILEAGPGCLYRPKSGCAIIQTLSLHENSNSAGTTGNNKRPAGIMTAQHHMISVR